MGVKKTYTKAEAKSAIETANQQYFGMLLRVRSDVTNDQLNSTDEMDGDDFAYRGRGSDVGHAFRHVDGTAPDGKSTFENDDSMYRAVMTLLNSPRGQNRLELLDTANPTGDERGYDGKSAMTQTISGSVASLNVYGKTQSGARKKVKKAMCIVQKLGSSTLWVHTAYPHVFDT